MRIKGAICLNKNEEEDGKFAYELQGYELNI